MFCRRANFMATQRRLARESGANRVKRDDRSVHVFPVAGAAESHLAAIIDSADDAIVSKNLEGVILSWNRGAERIFGWTAAEAVGRHIMLIIPAERRAEEDDILARIRRGESVDHLETVRVAKDGRRLDISVTVSPVKEDRKSTRLNS